MNENESRPTPDPTVLTTEALIRAVAAERDYVDGQVAILVERLRGIDIATKLLNETVNRVPTDVQKEVTHLRELSEEKFNSVATQFKERDTRSERESRDNKVAVDAAFAAQKEAASEQNKSNTLAISKSEAATTETINKLSELFKTTTDGLAQTIGDLKERVTRAETAKMTVNDVVTDRRGSISIVVAIVVAAVSSLIGVAGIVIGILSFIKH